MSEKITFRELIESIAEETDNSKQFTHDFIKDFVDVINGGLEEDGSVNIAGFGKFELRHMDERDGYNPQTEEKITIPAHNKVVFKPYKDLRELVNAPYAHLEPELIEDDDDQDDGSEEHADAKNEDEFIPTAPPTSRETEESAVEEEPGNDFEDPFGFGDQYTTDSTSSISDESTDSDESPLSDEETDESGDVVEFQADAEEKTKDDGSKDINDFITPIEPSEPKENERIDEEPVESFAEETEPETAEETSLEENQIDEKEKDEKSPYAPSFEESANKEEVEAHDEEPVLDETEEEQEPELEEETSTPSFASQQHSRKQSSKIPIFAAAAVVLLLVAAGAWYFSSSSNDAPQMAVSQPEPTTDVVTQNNDQQSQTATVDDQASSNAAKQKQNTAKKASSTASAATSASSNNTDLAIEEGQTLWSIAEDKYGNPRLWPWIYGNNGSLNDPDLIMAGTSLSVPLPSGPQNSLNATDSVGVAKGFISTYRWYKDNESMKAKNHLWAAKSYHDNIRDITDVQIDKADLVYANQSR